MSKLSKLTQLIKNIFFNVQNKTEQTCTAVINTEPDEPIKVCGNNMYGRGYKNGNEIRYCENHVPNGAAPAVIRTNPITFYVPATGSMITKDWKTRIFCKTET